MGRCQPPPFRGAGCAELVCLKVDRALHLVGVPLQQEVGRGPQHQQAAAVGVGETEQPGPGRIVKQGVVEDDKNRRLPCEFEERIACTQDDIFVGIVELNAEIGHDALAPEDREGCDPADEGALARAGCTRQEEGRQLAHRLVSYLQEAVDSRAQRDSLIAFDLTNLRVSSMHYVVPLRRSCDEPPLRAFDCRLEGRPVHDEERRRLPLSWTMREKRGDRVDASDYTRLAETQLWNISAGRLKRDDVAVNKAPQGLQRLGLVGLIDDLRG